MRLLFLLVLSLSVLNVCNAQIKFSSASQQRWKSSDPSKSDSGYDYSISISLNIPAGVELQPDSLWINGQRLKSFGKNVVSNSINKTLDSINLIALICYCKNSEGKMSKPEKALPPMQTKAEGIVSIVINGKKQYIEISQFSKLPDITR